jgi:hypothetical protein
VEKSAAERSQPSPAVACSLSSGDLTRRLARWRDLAAQADPRVSFTDRGLRLTFAAHPGVATELTQLVKLERDCCAFADWSAGQAGDRIVLDVTALTDDAIPSVQAMFSELTEAAP